MYTEIEDAYVRGGVLREGGRRSLKKKSRVTWDRRPEEEKKVHNANVVQC